MREIELKFQVPAARRAALQAAFAKARRAPLRAHYFDTEDGALARQAIALRLRLEPAGWVQTLKGGGFPNRIEHNVELGHSPEPPRLDIERHRADCPALHAALAAAGERLRERFCIEVQRRILTLRREGAELELAYDLGTLRAGAAREPLTICELEIELKQGPTRALFAEAARRQQRHGLWLDPGSKSARGTRLAEQGNDQAPPARAVAPAVEAGMPAARFARRVIAGCLQQVLANAACVAAGRHHAEDEHLHQLRIGLRRLRIAIEELAELNSGIDPNWAPLLAETFRRLGAGRDAAMLARLARQQLLQAAGAPVLPPAMMRARPGPDDADDAGECVRRAGFQSLLLAIAAFAHGEEEDEAGQAAFEGSVLEALTPRLDELHRRVRRAARRFEAAPAAKQHRARKRLKRLRYLAEFIAPLFRRKAVARYLQALEPAQEALGALNDRVVALHACRGLAGESAGQWFAIGWLAAQHRPGVAAAAAALARAADARPFWRGRPKA
ncbi:CHAD domain-containing protein [Roseateles violae]|uniref:CHAD domain-containing protein n=1 Tax=Roseateles violae TaxID=3058042 RepID=A0ABT8DRI8_9BURK|nr:CHAD domain-containing protein [Pelomonas sp. PFR6]MDN3919549.1 CHAD domain-containing protein [Pelomonas sp. PFR6]